MSGDAGREGPRLLVVMAKAPRPGRVKTRLSDRYPATAIVELYRCLLADTLALGLSIPGTDVAVMAPSEDLEEIAPLLPHGVRALGQQGSGLAAALTTVFATLTQQGARRVIALDSDSPHLPARLIEHAFAALLTHDIVAGPTEDGGYYLVGATAPQDGLFDPAPMGTATALESLLAKAGARGLTSRLTEEWFDVDVADDLARLAELLRGDPAASPRTAALLASWRVRPARDGGTR